FVHRVQNMAVVGVYFPGKNTAQLMLQNVGTFFAYRTLSINTDQCIGCRVPDIACLGSVIPTYGKAVNAAGFRPAHIVGLDLFIIHNAALPATADAVTTGTGKRIIATDAADILPAPA